VCPVESAVLSIFNGPFNDAGYGLEALERRAVNEADLEQYSALTHLFEILNATAE